MSQFFVLFLMAFSAFKLEATPIFGRYVGVLRHEHIAQDQLARLDFITEQESGAILKLRATLVIYFGDFDSDEYASYDYDNVTYNLLTGSLVFDSAGREVHFVVKGFDGSRLDAEVKTGRGSVGRLSLTRDVNVKVERALVQKIWGEYRGVCGGFGQRFQIQSSPSHPIATNRADPFAPFNIMAQLGDNGGVGCSFGGGTCVTKSFYDADYDIFSGHIDFHGDYGSLGCEVDSTGLTCGHCRYDRSSNESVHSGSLTYSVREPKWVVHLNETAPGSGLQGLYKGYVHLEKRDIYQIMTLAITTYGQGTAGADSSENLMVSVVSSIRFGGHTDVDGAITTKFDPRPFNLMNNQPVFDRADHSSDTIIKITKIGGGVLEGEWYSRRFGLVGRFNLTSSGSVELLEPGKLDSKLTGQFSDGHLNVQMMVAMSDQEINSKDPFSPLTLLGGLWYTDISSRHMFTQAAFDPFTGKFLLDTDGPGGAYIGYRSQHGLTLKIPNTGVMRPMQSHEFVELMEVAP